MGMLRDFTLFSFVPEMIRTISSGLPSGEKVMVSVGLMICILILQSVSAGNETK